MLNRNRALTDEELKIVSNTRVTFIGASDERNNIMQDISYFMKHADNAQLIFVSHSTKLLSNRLLRPDQIYTVDLEGERGSVINRVSNQQPREGQNLEKCTWEVYLMACLNTTVYFNKNKKIGKVLFIVEGERTEPYSLCRIKVTSFLYFIEKVYRQSNIGVAVCIMQTATPIGCVNNIR